MRKETTTAGPACVLATCPVNTYRPVPSVLPTPGHQPHTQSMSKRTAIIIIIIIINAHADYVGRRG